MTNAEAWFSIALRPRKTEGSLGRTAQDVHLDSHTAPELRGALVLLSCCLTSTEARWPIRDGDRVGRGQGDWLDRGNRIQVPGHDPLIFSFLSFSFLIGWEFYGPNYLRC